jgi:hypothetical protein
MPGKRQCALEQLLICAGNVSHKTLKFPKAEDVAEPALKSEIEHVYQKLGGILPSIPLKLSYWDTEFDGIAVELDEESHFNRYRTDTLKSTIDQRLPRFPLDAYQRYCSEHEDSCLRRSYGKYWTSPSCEKQFGPASPLKDLNGNGSPRWKQRAFYDFVKDLSPLLIGVKVVRVALWDVLMIAERAKPVGEMLDALMRESAPTASREATSVALAALIKERAAD